jgi:transcriptional regulator MraZ
LAFRGQHEHSLDTKDRLTIPARFRAALSEGVVLTAGLDPCVEVYPAGDYSRHEQDALAQLNPFSRADRMMRRRILARSHDDSLDSAGRIHLPKHLIEHASLGGTCFVVGLVDHLELWSAEAWGEHNQEIDAGAEEMAEEVARRTTGDRGGDG